MKELLAAGGEAYDSTVLLNKSTDWYIQGVLSLARAAAQGLCAPLNCSGKGRFYASSGPVPADFSMLKFRLTVCPTEAEMCCPRKSLRGRVGGRMSNGLHERLQQLPGLDRKGLLDLWLELFGEPAHKALRREMLVPILAYRMQEKLLGGLKPSTCKRLRRLAAEFADSSKSLSAPSPRMKAGTRIVREWQGQLHEVSVLDSGFEYQDQRFRSLSEIARQITGTRWSRPLFFGLKKRSGPLCQQ
jgi:hypothetical protein